MNLLEAMDDPNLFAARLCGAELGALEGFLSALFGLPVPRSSSSSPPMHGFRRLRARPCVRRGWWPGGALASRASSP